jgi:hypothetical protein
VEDDDAPELAANFLLDKDGVKGSDLLAAALVATTMPGQSADTFLQWVGLDTQVRLWCIGLCADPGARPYLEQVEAQVQAQERKEATTPIIQRIEQYRLPLIRPFLLYALLRCGQRDETTRYAYCRAVLELPYYAWRQRWIFEQSHDMRGIDPKIGKARLARAQRAVWQLDYAERMLPALFTPEVVGTDAIGNRAVLRALKEADCLKAVPLMLMYLDRVDPAVLTAFRDLTDAKIEPLRQYMKARE